MPFVTATTTATQIVLPDTTGTSQTNDSAVHIQNRGTVEVFYGPTSAVTATVGADCGCGLAAGATLEIPRPSYGQGYDLWVITASGSAEVRWVRF
jgi:hypothetical protein